MGRWASAAAYSWGCGLAGMSQNRGFLSFLSKTLRQQDAFLIIHSAILLISEK